MNCTEFEKCFSVSDMEWELIRINSLLVIAELEKATAKKQNCNLREELSLLEFEKHEKHFIDEEKNSDLQKTLSLRAKLHDEKNEQIMSLERQLLQTDSMLVAFQLDMQKKISENQRACLDLATTHRAQIELIQFEGDETEINLTEKLEDLQKTVNEYEMGLLAPADCQFADKSGCHASEITVDGPTQFNVAGLAKPVTRAEEPFQIFVCNVSKNKKRLEYRKAVTPPVSTKIVACKGMSKMRAAQNCGIPIFPKGFETAV